MPYVHVVTSAGGLRGIEAGPVTSFLGIPYGGDTSGAQRFRRPTPVESWVGVRDATEFGPSSPQPSGEETGLAAELKWLEHPRAGTATEGGPTSEDCLRLNVWTPATNGEARAVLVWLHGGAFTHGSGNEMWFNGDVLASTENIVVVTVTHRLGVLGFLDLRHADEGGERDSANAGMLDVVQALEWVRDNIERFGGDPTRVTIAGHSGGGAKVAALLAMPAARGLFCRAIMQSGSVRQFPTAEDTRATARRVMEALGNPTVDELRSFSIDRLLTGQAAAMDGFDGLALLNMTSLPGIAPSLDPVDLPAGPFDDDDLSHCTLLIGGTSHELGSLLAGTPIYSTTMDDEQAVAVLDHITPGSGGEEYVVATREAPGEPTHLRFARALTNKGFTTETTAIADAVAQGGGRVWRYRFEQPTEVLDGLLGACHGLEIPYVFGTTDRSPLTGRAAGRAALSREMMRAWGSFVKDGVPTASTEWRPWDAGTKPIHRFFVGGDAASSSHRTRDGVAEGENYDPARTPLGVLLRDPAARGVIEALAPDIPTHPMIGLAKALPLDRVLEMAGDAIPEEVSLELRTRIAALASSATPKAGRWRWRGRTH